MGANVFFLFGFRPKFEFEPKKSILPKREVNQTVQMGYKPELFGLVIGLFGLYRNYGFQN